MFLTFPFLEILFAPNPRVFYKSPWGYTYPLVFDRTNDHSGSLFAAAGIIMAHPKKKPVTQKRKQDPNKQRIIQKLGKKYTNYIVKCKKQMESIMQRAENWETIENKNAEKIGFSTVSRGAKKFHTYVKNL